MSRGETSRGKNSRPEADPINNDFRRAVHYASAARSRDFSRSIRPGVISCHVEKSISPRGTGAKSALALFTRIATFGLLIYPLIPALMRRVTGPRFEPSVHRTSCFNDPGREKRSRRVYRLIYLTFRRRYSYLCCAVRLTFGQRKDLSSVDIRFILLKKSMLNLIWM